MSTKAPHWTREQVLIALNLYCQLPFGKLDERTPIIIGIASLIGRTPGALAMKLNNLARHDPYITSTGRVGLKNGGAIDKLVWQNFRDDPEGIAAESQALMDNLVAGTPLSRLSSSAEVPTFEPATAEETTTIATVKLRRGQAFFRKVVLARYTERCCMTGLRLRSLLVASHIKPWSLDVENRINPQNGLCLSALHDRAYDLGLISVRPDFTIAISKEVAHDLSDLSAQSLTALNGRRIQLPKQFHPDKDLLDWHYSTLFKG